MEVPRNNNIHVRMTWLFLKQKSDQLNNGKLYWFVNSGSYNPMGFQEHTINLSKISDIIVLAKIAGRNGIERNFTKIMKIIPLMIVADQSTVEWKEYLTLSVYTLILWSAWIDYYLSKVFDERCDDWTEKKSNPRETSPAILSSTCVVFPRTISSPSFVLTQLFRLFFFFCYLFISSGYYCRGTTEITSNKRSA